MADHDLKTTSADTSFADGNVLFGADDQSSATPKPYTAAGIWTWIRGLLATSAAVQAAPSNPTGTTSVTAVHMGLGGTCKITPTYSGRLNVRFSGNMANNTATGIETVAIKYGTGTAPANGDAATGTTLGTALLGTSDANGSILPFSNGGIITGLTPGTQYWFDLTVLVNGGTGTLTNIGFTAFEF